MDFFTRFGIEKSRMTSFVMFSLLALGVMSYFNLSKREDPAIVIRSAIVVVQFPGMAPERMEQVIVTNLEQRLREIGEIEDINVLVATGAAQFTISVKESISAGELPGVFQDIRNKMSEAKVELPPGTLGPFVNTDYGDVTIATVAVTGEGFSISEIEDVAEDLKEFVYTLDGISKVTLLGKQEERIWLEIDSRKLAAVGVDIPQILSDLQAQNVILPAGQLNANGINLTLEANGDLGSVEEIGNVLTKIKGLDGFVRLKELLTVRRGYEDPRVKPSFFNGEPAIMAAIEMADGVDIQKIGRQIKKAVHQFEKQQPIGISFRLSTNQESKVTEAVNGALSNVAQTFVVVLIVMLIFLGLKPAIIVASIVPFTVSFALIAMSYFDIALEQVSIAAVIISLGLLVDNGLVVVEDIQGRLARGASTVDAALGSGRQFAIPLGIASITTVSAFLPLLLLEGTSGEYAFSLGAVVGIMLAGSWLTALYILPALGVWFISAPKKKADRSPNLIIEAYGKIIRLALPLAPVVIAASYIAVAGSLALFSNVKKEMFPLSERNQYLVYMDMPKGTAISATETRAKIVDRWLRDKNSNPEISDTTIYVGGGGPRFYLALNPADTIPSSAFFLINTDTFKGAVIAAERTRRYLVENHPEARFKIKRLAMGGKESGIVEINISGQDADRLLQLSGKIERRFAEAPGIVQNENDWGNKVIKVVIDVAQNKAREVGLTSESISDVMETYFTGTTVSTYREGDDSIPIVVRAGKNFRDSLEDLQNLSVLANGQLISLDQVADFRPQLELYQLRRENQRRLIKISAKSNVLSGAELLAFVQKDIDALDLGGGYQVEIGGETADSGKTNEDLAAGLPLALLVMFAALIYQFNSLRRVLLTFMTIPLVIIGAPIALQITGLPMSFFATLGLISLAGIIINNAIVLIDQIDLDRRSMNLIDAVIAASEKRVTPILLTSLTTVTGLLPLLFFGGVLWAPMAALMIGGLAVASLISLVFVPATYYLMFRFEKAEKVA